ncbi:unnamed protein product [Vicia faba]|uniref:Uncharacterized protein n=1 Tax=Vicia faba TaxID=3906 RepID=A0AAV0Z928_VICFA|nr:unnamed protein product [Vicia faba]
MGNENSIPLNGFLDVGKNVTQIFNITERYLDEDKLMTYYLSYYAGSTKDVQLMCETTSDKEGVTRLAVFRIYQNDEFIQFSIEKTENDLLKIINSSELRKRGLRNFNYENKGRSGEVTKTYVVFNGNEQQGSLFVVEEKRKSGIENPYVVTLAHYYANYSHAFFGWKTYDAGLSVIVNIRVVNNNMDFVWFGPHNNSSRALLPKFELVLRTKTWKWDTCPYRAAETCRTNSETADEEGSYVQLNNQGVIKGKNNGNVVVKNLYLKGRRKL